VRACDYQRAIACSIECHAWTWLEARAGRPERQEKQHTGKSQQYALHSIKQMG
jgi:hypothetical protein